jgi:drug/metabolite transporter (DMT)-like permease
MQNALLFLVMSLIWGLTWIAAKAGVNAVPPIFFVAIRYLLVGTAMLALVSGVSGLFALSKVARIVLTGALVNVGTYSLLFWAIQSVPSGVAGLINLALTPVALFGFAILVGDEEASWRHAFSLILGLTGLGLLFFDKVGTGATDIWGVVAIVLGTFSYALGSVLSRPLLETASAAQVTAAQAVVGGVGLMALSVLLEPLSRASWTGLLAPAPVAGLLFLVIAGTFVAYTIYLQLVRDWGAPRAGLYAFVSPVIALLSGWAVFDEPIGWRELLATLLLFGAASVALTPAFGSSPASRLAKGRG